MRSKLKAAVADTSTTPLLYFPATPKPRTITLFSFNRQTVKLFACLLCLTLVLKPDLAYTENINKNNVLRIGIVPMSSTRSLFKNYQPLQTYLQLEMKQPVELITAPDFKTFHANTIEGKYDVVVTAAHLGRLAQTSAHYLPLARYKAPHRTLLLIAKDQPVKSLHELRGKMIAGIDPHALAMIEALSWLDAKGLLSGTDFNLMETPTPLSAAYALQSHQAIMAIGSIQSFNILPDNLKQDIEIFTSLPELPSLLWLAHPRIQADAPRLKAALLGFTSKSSGGELFYETTGYMGMREVSAKEMTAVDPSARAVATLLNKK